MYLDLDGGRLSSVDEAYETIATGRIDTDQGRRIPYERILRDSAPEGPEMSVFDRSSRHRMDIDCSLSSDQFVDPDRAGHVLVLLLLTWALRATLSTFRMEGA